MKKLFFIIIIVFLASCGKTEKLPILKETQITTPTIKQQSFFKEAIFSKFANIHNETYVYSFIKDSLYFFNSNNDTIAIDRIFIDSVCLSRDSIWIPFMCEYNYSKGFNLTQFARLLFGYVNLLDSIDYFKIYEKDTFSIYDYRLNNEYIHIKYATQQEYYDTNRNFYRDDIIESSQFNAWLLWMKLGKKYFKICDKIEKLGTELIELWMSCSPGWHGTGMITVLETSREESFISLYMAVNKGYNVLNKPSKNFQKQKKQFIKQLTFNSKKHLITCLNSTNGDNKEFYSSLWRYCKIHISKINELINNDFLLEYAKNNYNTLTFLNKTI